MNPLLSGLTITAFLFCASGLAQNTQQTITFSRVVDLSHVISSDIPLWPGDPPVELEAVADFEADGYYLRRFSMGEHSATHMNAPKSFHKGATGIDAYSPESLVVPAAVIEITDQAAADPDYQLSKADILTWEERYGPITAGSVVLLHTGWQDKWADPAAFFNVDAAGEMHFPGFSSDATLFLLRDRKVAGVGIDTHGVDPAQDEEYATNTQVLAEAGIVLENLTNLHELPPTGATLVIGLLKLLDGSGSPVSVLAFVP